MNIYIVVEQTKVGITTWPAKVIGAYSTIRKANRVAKENSYRHVVTRALDDQ